MFDVDKGLKGSVVHHKPLNILQLKRLLLIFDELHFTHPEDNLYFLEEGAICYYYKIEDNQKILYSLDGHEILKKYSHVKKPDITDTYMEAASVIRTPKNSKFYPFDPIILANVLPYYKGELFKKNEETLLDRFEKAINKDHIKFLDYKSTDFYLKNAISLKIAYDFDVTDREAVNILKPLLVNEESEPATMFLPSQPFLELVGFEYFPKPNYTSPFNGQDHKKFNYEKQFFSIIAKVNKKLALTEKFDLILIIIDDNIHKYYQFKIEKSRLNQDTEFIKSWNEIHNYKLMNLNNLIFKASNIFISNDQLRRISIPEILSFKERCISDLYKLRKELFTDINSIISQDIGRNDLKDLNKLIGKKIIPELSNYQSSQNQILEKTVSNSLKFTLGAGSAYLGLVQGLSPILIAILGGVSPILTDKMITLSGKLRETKRNNYENTFSYFLNLTT